MKNNRVSYIPNVNNKLNITWPIMTLVSFLITLILLVLLIFSHLETINNLVNISQYENKIKELKEEYDTSLSETNDVNEKLITLKRELVALDEVEGTKLVFYNHIKTLYDIENDFAQKIYSSLNTRSILKDHGDYIFINKNNKISICNDFIFEKNSKNINKESNDFFQVLSKKISEIMKDEVYGKFVDTIIIEMNMQKNYKNDDLKLSYERGEEFKNKLISSNDSLKEFKDRIIVTNRYDNFALTNDIDKIYQNDRIDLTLRVKADVIYSGAKFFITAGSKEAEKQEEKVE